MIWPGFEPATFRCEDWRPIDRVDQSHLLSLTFFTAPLSDCLLPNQSQFRIVGKPWLKNSTTKCFCNSNLRVECVTLDEPACTDISGVIRNNSEVWLNSSCVKCTCVNGSIDCFNVIVNITYGFFKVDEFETCEQCGEPPQSQEAISSCEGIVNSFLNSFSKSVRVSVIY